MDIQQPAPTPLQEKKRDITPTLVITILVGVFTVLFFVVLFGKKSLPRWPSSVVQPTPTSTPTPTPRAIKQGKETYRISSSAPMGPQILEATIDPHDPKIGDLQTMVITAKSVKPITQLSVDLQSDNEKTAHALALASGSVTDGTWEGSWIISDTVLYNYVATITATDGNEKTSIDITMR